MTLDRPRPAGYDDPGPVPCALCGDPDPHLCRRCRREVVDRLRQLPHLAAVARAASYAVAARPPEVWVTGGTGPGSRTPSVLADLADDIDGFAAAWAGWVRTEVGHPPRPARLDADVALLGDRLDDLAAAGLAAGFHAGLDRLWRRGGTLLKLDVARTARDACGRCGRTAVRWGDGHRPRCAACHADGLDVLPPDALVTAKEVYLLTGASIRTVWSWVRRGKLAPAVRGREHLYRAGDVRAARVST